MEYSLRDWENLPNTADSTHVEGCQTKDPQISDQSLKWHSFSVGYRKKQKLRMQISIQE